MSGQVTELRPNEEGKFRAGVNISFQTDLGEGRVLTMQTVLLRDETPEEQAGVLRSLLAMSDKEKAHYELVDMRFMVMLKERGMKRAEEDVERLGSMKSIQEQEIDVEIGELTAEIGRTQDGHKTAWDKSGRGGEFRPSAPQKQQINGILNAIGKLNQQKADLHAQIGNERRDTQTALAREMADVNMAKDKIERCLMILGLPSEM